MQALLMLRNGLGVMCASAVLSFPLQAGETPPSPAEPWQAVIDSQIQAFRDHDASEAFRHAGGVFQAAFPNAQTFFVAIVQSGYAPIVESSAHSFGVFRRIGHAAVVQQVKFVGNDQMLYDALYELVEEPGGWRVQGVQLMRPRGVAV